MKKIKLILLFGILTLLGIGSSFSQFYELNDLTGSQLILPSIKHYSSSPRTRFTFTLGNTDYFSSSYTSYNHQLTDIYACYDSNLNVIGFKDGRGGMTFGDVSSCSLSGKISVSTGPVNGINTFTYLYLSSSTPISPYSERSPANISSYMYFDFNNLHTNYGSFQDVPDGYIRSTLFLNSVGNYGVVSKSLSDGSFSFSSIFRDSFVFNENTNILDSFNVYSGILLLHFNDYSNDYYGGSNTLLLFLNEDSISYNYYTGYWSFYEDFSYYNVSPTSKGYLTYNNSISEGYSQFLNMLSSGNSQYKNIILTNGNISSNLLNFTYYYYSYYTQSTYGAGLFTNTGTYSFNFEVNESVPDFIEVNQGGGTQSTGSIAINTGFLDLCLNNLEFGELNSYLCSKLLNGNNLVLIPNMTGYYLSYGYDENGNLRFWITYQEDLEQQMSGFVWVQDENGNRYTTCPSGDCLGTILAKPINHGDGNVFEFNTGVVLDMMSNLTGWVGRCPFPYTDFRLGKNLKLLQTLQDWGFNYDPFIIVNCAVAGFHYGRNSINQSLVGDVFEYPLLYGDTQKHQILFNFLDFIVILGLIGLFTFIRKIF